MRTYNQLYIAMNVICSVRMHLASSIDDGLSIAQLFHCALLALLALLGQAATACLGLAKTVAIS
jgi:hypothetical protein